MKETEKNKMFFIFFVCGCIFYFLFWSNYCSAMEQTEPREKIPLIEVEVEVGTIATRTTNPEREEEMKKTLEEIKKRRTFMIAEIMQSGKVKITEKRLKEAKDIILKTLLAISEQLPKEYVLVVSSVSRNPQGGGRKSYHSCEDPTIGAIDCWIEKKNGEKYIKLAQIFLIKNKKQFEDKGIKILELFGPSTNYWIGHCSNEIEARHKNHIHCAVMTIKEVKKNE